MAAKPNKTLIALYLKNLLRSLDEKAEFEKAMKALGIKSTRIN